MQVTSTNAPDPDLLLMYVQMYAFAVYLNDENDKLPLVYLQTTRYVTLEQYYLTIT